ncbi:probable thiopurine S-methyltransferase isoform X1 [Ptychodera flava]|uniref:probable thiopurine S-methyltransferase isoform X1 n=1 Tax=Ptychodera flava TaxID=63121 RepID=UPI00396A9431
MAENIDPVPSEQNQLRREQEDDMTPETWNERWKQGRAGFHINHVSDMMKDQKDLLTNGREGISVFFPMCGKSFDMKWLADLGYKIIGVEYSEIAITSFFQEQKIDYTTQPVDRMSNCTLYKSLDERIKIYQCDIFKISSEITGQVDAIWDRGAFNAIMYKERRKYGEMILPMMKADTRYLLLTSIYDKSQMTAPPQCIPIEEVLEIFGARCTVQKIAEYDDERDIFKKKGLKWIKIHVHLLTLKIKI